MSIYSDPNFAQNYDFKKFGGKFGHFLESFETHSFIKLLESSDSIIDIGCGSGKLLGVFPENTNVIGADLSLEMIKIAKEKVQNDKINFVVCDAQKLPFKSKSTISLTCSRNLMHLKDPHIAIEEFCRITRKNIIVDFPNLYSFSFFHMLFRRVAKLFAPKTEAYSVFSSKKISMMFSKCNYHQTNSLYYFYFPLGFYRVLKCPKCTVFLEGLFQKLKLTSFYSSYIIAKYEPVQ